jgi:hypothetical protein
VNRNNNQAQNIITDIQIPDEEVLLHYSSDENHNEKLEPMEDDDFFYNDPCDLKGNKILHKNSKDEKYIKG